MELFKYCRINSTNAIMLSLLILGYEAKGQDLDGTNEPDVVITGRTITAGNPAIVRVVDDGTYWNAAGAGGSQDILLDPASYVGNISNFNLTINGTGLDYVYGGLTDQGNVQSNTVNISEYAVVNKIAYGGYTAEGNASNNNITVAGTVNGNVNGAHVKTIGDVINNSITITQTGEVNDNIYGGSTKTGNAIGNKITVAGTVDGDTDGSYIETKGDASGNSVIIEETGSATGNAYGSFTTEGSITDNNVTVAGTVQGNIYGGYTANGGATGNNVIIEEKGTVDADTYGSYSLGGNISNSSVIVTGMAQGNVYGSYTYQGDITNNNVVVSGTVSNDIYGGYTEQGNITNSNINVSGTANDHIYGGYTADGDVSGNNITISGTVGSSIYGGYTSAGAATSNTVNISQAAQLSSTGRLMGGNGTNDSFSGNTLNLNGWTGTVSELQNFEHYNITLPNSFAANDTVINIGGGTSTLLDNPNNPGQKATFVVNNAAGVLVKPGDKFTVISNTAMSDSSIYQVINQGLQGIGIQYDYSLANTGDGTALDFTILSTGVNPQTKSLQQVRNAPATFLNTATDFAVNQGLKSASEAQLRPLGEDGWGLGVFVIGGGSSVKQKTGSHVDVDGVNFITGLSVGNHNIATPVTLSAFFEAGNGNYNSYNSFANASRVKGDGDLSYRGGGVMGKVENLVGNLYVEGSFRLGRYKSNYSSGDFYVPGYLGGRLPKFNLNGNYYSAHAGLGYVFDLSDSVKADTAVKYLWSRLDGGNVNLLGDKFHFNDMNSHRVQTGGRLLWNMSNKTVSPYVGAWYEYEFDGKSKGSVQGLKLPETELKGSTGIFETGLTIRPNQSPLAIDLGVTGSVGRREGIGGHATLNWSF